MTTLTTQEARKRLAEVIDSAAYGRDRVVLTRRGKKLAAVVSIEDLERLEHLEDLDDLRLAEEALADPENAKRVPWEQVKQALNL